MEPKTISVIGLGKLGAPMVAAFASRGFRVIGVDINPENVRLVNEARPPVFEPQLEEYLAQNRERISATEDFERAVLESDITFIIVPTPSNPEGAFSTQYVREAGEQIGKALAKKSKFHLVVLTSTVLPGSTEADLLPVLEAGSRGKVGVDFGLCYNPEFIALGSVIRDLLHPDFILIGESDSESGDILESFYKKLCEENPPIKRMNIVNAEITKIALNTYVTTKISYANMLAELCEKVPGGNVDVVTGALGDDSRIGHKFLRGGTAYGGPCFPRDNRALSYTARKFGLSLPIAEATDAINKNQTKRLVDLILSHLPSEGKAGILGLSYKPGTNVIEESQGMALALALRENNIPVIVYDPLGMESARHILDESVEYALSSEELLRTSHVVCLITPWEEFRSLEPSLFENQNMKLVVIDCWRHLNPEKLQGIVTYIPLGIYS